MLTRLVVCLLLFAGAAAAEPMGPPRPVAATPDSELAACEKFLHSGKFKADEINYVRFFTTFTIPEKWQWKKEVVNLRESAEKALPFVLNSCASVDAEQFVERPRRVPGSDTLWYVNIQDFGWTEEDVDAVFRIQPYMLAPLVSGKNNAILFRADWFIVNAMDVTKQQDRGLKDNDAPYYILQYHLGHAPKDKFDFLKAWEIDEEGANRRLSFTGTIVDKGDSGVSQHTRRLARIRTEKGYYWKTSDVKSHDIDPDKVVSRDYVEDLFAHQADAGEYISSNKRGLQTYLLTAGNNDKFKVVPFGDPTIVVDRQDPHDPRVRTGKSCVVCHALGVIPYTSVIADLFRAGGDVLAQYKDVQREIKAFYRRFKNGEEVQQDNELFEQAVKECNGLDPLDNMKGYLAVYEWYWNEKVTPEQAAVECGVTPEDLRAGIKPATTGRLVFLYKGKPMPREIWDSVNVGGYVQAMLLIKVVDVAKTQWAKKAAELLHQKPTEPEDRPTRRPTRPADGQRPGPKPEPPEDVGTTVFVKGDRVPLLDADGRPTVYLSNMDPLTVLAVEGERYRVRVGRWEGYIKKSDTFRKPR
jgi:hypothetical protein